jgi:hypothetical protein
MRRVLFCRIFSIFIFCKKLGSRQFKSQKGAKKAHPKSRNAASGCAYIQIKKIKALL